MSEESVNQRIQERLERDLAKAIAKVLHAEAYEGLDQYIGQKRDIERLQKKAERKAKTLGRFEASVRRGPPPPTPTPGPAKWGDG